jgi:hypothetical protein
MPTTESADISNLLPWNADTMAFGELTAEDVRISGKAAHYREYINTYTLPRLVLSICDFSIPSIGLNRPEVTGAQFM